MSTPSNLADPSVFDIASADAVARGGFSLRLSQHVVAWLPAGNRRLCISFDNLAADREGDRRYPWGYDFLSAQGWDVLGVMMRRPDWFRAPDLWDTFDHLRDEGFFARYDHVSLYGSSMGAYGAATFARAIPGATVVAFAPQTTLERSVVPFERRYRAIREIPEWGIPYADAADGVRDARRVYVFYDPCVPQDRAHAARLTGPNIMLMPVPHAGHKIPPMLSRMGLLKPVSIAALEGSLTPVMFQRLWRQRHSAMPWMIHLLEAAAARGHRSLALGVAERLMAQRKHWRMRELIRQLRDQ